MFVGMAYMLHQHIHLIMGWLDKLGVLASCLFLVLYCLMSIFCLPEVLLGLAGGALFGLVEGTFLNVLGSTLGAICGFYIGRYWLPHPVMFEENTRVGRLMRQVDRHGWKVVAWLRLTPAPYNLVNYGLGFTHIKWSHYVITTMICVIPSRLIWTYCGYAGISFV